MLFEAHDNINTIHLGNYEEFFILYMDNELSEKQVKMVDEFLAVNPDLKAEFEILRNTKLPLEEFVFDKKDLLAEPMKLSSVKEELLLYIDNELTIDERRTVELELASDRDYRLQHHALLQTKLNPSEKIEYPNKKELYRRTERVIAFKPWMKVAAALLLATIGGMFYFKNSSHTASPEDFPITAKPVPKNNPVKNDRANPKTTSSENSDKDQVAINSASKKEIKPNQRAEQKREKEENSLQQDRIAYTPQENETEREKVNSVQFNEREKTIALVEPNISINNYNVTSPLLTRTTNEPAIDQKELIANNDRKGSVKGFLRKATRMIEKRTGIDPTNENGELLIGAVAINLK